MTTPNSLRTVQQFILDEKNLHYGTAEFLRRSYAGGSEYTFLPSNLSHFSPRTGLPLASYLMQYKREDGSDWVARLEDSTYINMVKYIVEHYEDYVISAREQSDIQLPDELKIIDFEQYINPLLLYSMILITIERTGDNEIKLTLLTPNQFFPDPVTSEPTLLKSEGASLLTTERIKGDYIFLYFGSKPSLCNSPVYDACFLNKDHYNRLSLLTYYCHYMTFSFLRYQQPTDLSQAEKDEEKELGNSSIIYYPEGTNAPDFISPPAVPSDMLDKYLTHIEELLFKLSGVESQTDRIQERHSGLAIVLQSSDKFQRINRLAKKISKCENMFWKKICSILELKEIAEIKYIKLTSEIPVGATSKQRPMQPTETINEGENNARSNQ